MKEREIPGARVRLGSVTDLKQIVAVHQAAFPHHFLTTLGPVFLSAYYSLVMGFDRNILLVSVESGQFRGFVAGYLDSKSFYEFMKRNWLSLAPGLALGVMQSPRVIAKMFANVFRVLRSGNMNGQPSDGCELASIAVDPQCFGRGIGRELVASFLESAWSQRAARVYLTTDAIANDRVNDFYSQMGFQLDRSLRRYGNRVLNEFSIPNSLKG